MIEFISGKLIEKTPTYAVIDTNGVGYVMNITLNTYSIIEGKTETKLFTHLAIREDAHVLFGFAEQSERQLFRQLISVSGIGPSTARMILSSLSAEELHQAIVEKNISLLKSVKGVGPKSAERIVIDLKDKLEKEGYKAVNVSSSNNTFKSEALSALVMLGFANPVANKAIENALKTDGSINSVEKLIKAALKQL
jgi:Holliday junction DNA helicase RuvA